MSNIRSNKGQLFFDFRYQGKRCREYTKLIDTPAKRKKMHKVLDKIEAEITLGTFCYAAFFPNSKRAEAFADVSVKQSDSRYNSPLYRNFVETWYTENFPLWRHSHASTVRSTLDQHLIPAFGEQPIGSISKADTLAFRAQVVKRPGRCGNKTLSAKTVNRIIQIHSQIMGEAAERFDFTNPVERIKALKQQRPDIHPLSLDEAQLMIQTINDNYRDYLITRFFTGMRTGEINGLQKRYLDFDNNFILVRKTLVRGQVEHTKTDGSQRDIAMSQPVREALLRQCNATSKSNKFVFCNHQGNPIDLDNFTNRVWYPLLDKLGLEKRRPYQTRHTAATLWLGAGENPEWVARQLGHTDTEMLFKTYSRFIPNLTRRDGSAFEAFIRQSMMASKGGITL